MKIALVHDFLKEYGGGERVLEVLHEMFPEAPVFTAYYDEKAFKNRHLGLTAWNIKTSWMQNWSLGGRLISPFRIFAPSTFENFDLAEFDLIISSSSTYFANAVITAPGALHINYVHSPPRYLYGYATSYNYKKHWWTRISGEIANHFLRLWDFEISQRPDILVANSENIKKRIAKFYRREAVIIYPPIDVTAFSHQSSAIRQSDKKYYLSVGRLVRGKGIEDIVKAFTNLKLPLKVVGSGPLEKELKEISRENIEFLGHVKDEDLAGIYTGAKATIVASVDEDFGIVPIESQACGTPVLACESGGYLETVIPGKTGEFFGGDRQQVTADSIINAVRDFDSKKYDPKDCQKQAEKFGKDRFKKEILELVKKNLRG